MPTPTAARKDPDPSTVAAKAVTRAAELLDITGRDLAAIIGVSEASLSRMKRGDLSFRLSGKPYELALLFIRLYRSLDAIMGGDDTASRQWVRSVNSALGGQPLSRIKSIDGLTHVLAYLDARRAPL